MIGLPSWIARLEIPGISRGVETKANLWVDVGSLTIYTGDLWAAGLRPGRCRCSSKNLETTEVWILSRNNLTGVSVQFDILERKREAQAASCSRAVWHGGDVRGGD